MQAASSLTQQFQFNLPFALASLSPALSALHSSRARILHPSGSLLSETHCARCGASLVHGCGETRSMRSSKRGKVANNEGNPPSIRKFQRRTCIVCGYFEDIPIQRSGPSFPPPRQKQRTHAGHIVLPSQNSLIETASETAPSPHPEPSQQPEPHSSLHLPRILPSVSIQSSRSSSREPASAPSSSVPSRPKAKTRKPGLQALLARNREMQEQEKRQREQGLSTFLQGLQ